MQSDIERLVMRFSQTLSVVCLLLLFGVTIVGCNQPASSEVGQGDDQPPASTVTVNEYCPMMGGKISEEGGTVEWDGKTIGFCCDGCDEKFMALSDEEKAEKLTAAIEKSEGASSKESHQHGENDQS